MANKEIIFSDKRFNVITVRDSKSNCIGVERNNENIIILPYIVDEFNNLDKIGCLWEYNLLRKNSYTINIISGTKEPDEHRLDAAKRELFEESGLEISDDLKWTFVGKLYASKFDKSLYPCYLVDATNITIKEKSGDGSKSEKLSIFKFLKPDEIIDSKE